MNKQNVCRQGMESCAKNWQKSNGLDKDSSSNILKRYQSVAKKAILLGTAALMPLCFAQTAHAQVAQREIINPSFEDGPNPATFVIGPDADHPGWISTNGVMETWRAGFQNRSAQDGTYLVELNPSSPVGLYQEVCLVNGESLSWDFYHAARTSRTTPANQTINYEVLSLDGLTTHQLLTSNTVTEAGNNNNQSQNDWENVVGSTIYTGPTGIQRLQFRSTNGGAAGNFLDNINVDLVPSINFNGIDTADFENVNPTLPVLLVSGVVSSPLTITIDATAASTATEGVDYDFVTKTIAVPVGTYDGTSLGAQFQIPITVYEDADDTEADETIVIGLISAVADDPVFNPITVDENCNVPTPEATITHTILNTLIIEAEVEAFPAINGLLGGVTTSVLDSDLLGGVAVDPNDVTLTVGNSDPELTLDPATGLITVAPGTPAGTYTVEYTICEDANPTNCATVTETVTVVVPTSDLSLTKTNTPGVNGEVDQPADTLTSGASTTYTVVITNNGPDAVTGAVVTDTVGAGLTCNSTDAVTISGDGVPAGSFTIGDLTGGGITLDTLADGESATLTYTCEVN